MTPTAPLVDIGVNLTDRRFAADLDAVLARARAAGIVHMLVTGTDVAHSRAAAALAARHPGFLSCCVGVHPHHAEGFTADDTAALRALAAADEVRAIGETGLDFARDLAPRPAQVHAFEAQLALAAELRLPVFVHDRDTDGAVAAVLARWRAQLPGVVVHCFTGGAADLDALLALDCHIGITGWVCDERRGVELARLVPRIPEHRLLIETDAPYLVPRTLRPRPQRNEPMYLPEVLATLARLRGCAPDTLARATTANAVRLFGLPPDDAGRAQD